jgi:hypothetical protein
MVWVNLPRSDIARILFVVLIVSFWVPLRPLWDALIPEGTATPIHTLTLLSFQCYGLLILLGFMVVLQRRQGSRKTSPETRLPSIQDSRPKQ